VFYVLSFIYGAAIGSFVEVVATRLNVAPIVKSKSKCLSCGEALRASDLIPLFSYIFLKGRCRYCKVPYGKEAVLVEIAYGAIFTLLYQFFLSGLSPAIAPLWLLYYTLLFICLGVIALYDYKHSYVPVLFLALFSILAFLMLGIRYGETPTSAVLLGPLVVAFPFLLIWAVSRGRALGFGDVVLYAAVGAFFGIEQGLAVLLISIWVGAVIGIIVYLDRKRRNVTSTAMPFVPFIVAAFLFVLFTDISIFSIASLFA
jgi:prepilin signal peptidase PulO-like enzyme (type II secretory pathway)